MRRLAPWMKRAALLALTLLALPACDDDDGGKGTAADAGTEAGSIVAVAAADGRFSTLVTAVEAAGLAETLAGAGPFTVFAPTDDAFAALPSGALDGLLADPAALAAVLKGHVVAGRLTASDVVAAGSLTTLEGTTLAVEAGADGTVTVGGATVILADVPADNGIIHAIGGVILPAEEPEPEPELPTIAALVTGNAELSTLASLVVAAGLAETLDDEGTYTVFAPTNAAFAAVGQETLDALAADIDALTAVLLYHAAGEVLLAADVAARATITTLQGATVEVTADADGVRINGARVTMADVKASNGVVHIIDAVLLPPSDPEPEPGDIVEVATAAGAFTTLLAAAEAAGLVDTLQSEGPFTVFAPTDAAFAALGQETIDALLADPEALRRILLFHVVPGRFDAAAVVAVDALTTAEGSDVPVVVDGDEVKVGGAAVVTADVAASNGIIHVIDAVMLPPEPEPAPRTIVDVATEAGSFNTLLAAVGAAGLTDALRGEGPFTVFAPTDAAFAALGQEAIDALLADPAELATVLTYHVVPGRLMASDVLAGASLDTLQGMRLIPAVDGEIVTISGATLVMTDVEADNGVIHVIDAVLLPPGNIAQVAAEAGSFSTLLAAVEAAGLVDALTGTDPLTVFAPTDAAFALLGEATINALLADPETLANILLYHVVGGRFFAADVVAAASLTTLSPAGDLTVAVDADGVTLNGVRVVATDIQARNGVIHVLDAVIVP